MLWMVCGLFMLGVYLYIEPLYTPTAISTPSHHAYFPEYIAHKGLVSHKHTGNTLEAIHEALESEVNGIEIDVRFSKDNVPFLYHGDTLEENTNGKGAPESYTWKQLKKFRYSNHVQSRLISLEELFEVVGSKKYLFLDIKTTHILDNHRAEKISSLIQRYHLKDTTIVESFNPFFLIWMRLSSRDILLMYDFTTNSQALGEEVQSQFAKIPWILKHPFFQKQIRRIVRPDILGPRWNTDKNLMKILIDHGYPVIAWTVDDMMEAKKLFSLGIKGIQTNSFLKLRKNLSKQKNIIYDMGGSKSRANVIHVHSQIDVLKALQSATCYHKKITIAGRRHSMGGQALLDDSIHLNMLGLNKVHYNKKTQHVVVEAGATWQKVQNVVNNHGRSIKIMQSDNIFSVGGSISANVHGWQVGMPPIGNTIVSMKVVTSDGKIRFVSRKKDPDLFKAIIGGYGQFGVIIEVELETVPNTLLQFHQRFIPSRLFAEKFQEYVTQDPRVELAYGRLSVGANNLFEDAGIFWYEKVGKKSSNLISTEPLIALKRFIFRNSEYTPWGKSLRWKAEQFFTKVMSHLSPVSRNSAMNTDIHILWHLYGKNKDILQEYFIPKNKLNAFLKSLKLLIFSYNMNLLNATIREVKKDELSLLPYASQDMFGIVLLFSQGRTFQEEEKMKRFTKEAIDAALNVKGTFYLTYRLHYTKKQLLKAYPSLQTWMNIKRKWDPQEIFSSQFLEYIKS